jgi:uncharacterized protein
MAAPAPIRLRLRVSPAARGRGGGAICRHGDAWKVRVSAPPEQGKANEAVLRLLADRLRLARERIVIVSGRAGRDKVVELSGIEADEAARRLAGGG